MVQSVIGALRVNLGLDAAQFEKGTKDAGKSLESMRNQFAVVAGAAAALGAAIGAAAMKSAAEIDKTAKSARRLDASITAFRALEMAAGEAGVNLSSLTGDLQTMNRELANIGKTGKADEALKSLGLSIADLTGIDADEKIAVIADRVKELGLSSGQATALLRDLGVRNREMVLLMLGGGDVIRDARKDIEDYGLALSNVDAAKIELANDRIGRLGIAAQYVGQQLALTLVPAFGQLAVALTDSMREGGLLRTVLDGLIGNLDRIGTYISVAVVGFGTRYVAALVAAKLATLSLSGALALLRRAIIATGFGALIVGASELILWFGRLVTATGGFGNAMAALKDVAVEVWDRIGLGAKGMVLSMKALWLDMKAGFLDAISDMASGAHDMLWNLSNGMQGVPGMEGIAETISSAADAMSQASLGPAVGANDARGAANSARGVASSLFSQAGAPLQSLSGLMKDVATETGTATDSIDAMNDALDATGDAVGGGGGGKGGGGSGGLKDSFSELGKTIEEMMEEAKRKSEQTADSIKNSMTDAFKGIITGATSLRDGLSSIFANLADMFLTNAGDDLFGGLSKMIGNSMFPAFANGTNYAPGGMAIVGERGPELVNLPRGSQVVPNHRMQNGGEATVKLYIEEAPSFAARVRTEAQGVAVETTKRNNRAAADMRYLREGR